MAAQKGPRNGCATTEVGAGQLLFLLCQPRSVNGPLIPPRVRKATLSVFIEIEDLAPSHTTYCCKPSSMELGGERNI